MGRHSNRTRNTSQAASSRIKCQLHEDEWDVTTCHQRGLKGLLVKSVSFEFLHFTFSQQSEENNELNSKLETGRLKKSSKILGVPTKTFNFTYKIEGGWVRKLMGKFSYNIVFGKDICIKVMHSWQILTQHSTLGCFSHYHICSAIKNAGNLIFSPGHIFSPGVKVQHANKDIANYYF